MGTQTADPIDEFIALPQDQQLSTLQQLPQDKQDALLARVRERKTTQTPSQTAGPVSRFLSSAWAPIASAATGMYHAAVDGPQNPEEAHFVGEGQGDNPSWEAGPFRHPLLMAKRLFIDPAKQQATQAHEAFSQSNPTSLHPTDQELANRQLAVGHALATVIPGVGPWAANVGQTLGEQVGAGDLAGAGGTVVGNTALMVAPKMMGKVVRTVPVVARGAANIIAGTGPKVAEDLAAKTAEVNKGAAEATAKANQKAEDFNNRVNAKHAATVEKVTQNNDALNHMLDRRKQMEAKLGQDTQAYYDLEDAKKAEAKAQENAAWQPWRKKMETATIDGGEIAKALEKVAGNSPEVTRQLRQLQASPADAAPDSLYAQDRAAIMKSQGYTGDYFDYPENIRSKIDQIAQSSGFEPDPIDFDPEAGKPISIEAVHRANSILQQYIRSGRYEGPLLGEMKQVAKTLRAAITRASIDAGAGPELEAARQATIKYQEAFGRERHLPTTHDEIREKQANPEAFKERNDEERLQGASTVAPELTDAYRNVKSQRDALKSFPTEDALRKQIKQTPEPPTMGDLRSGYNLKDAAKLADVKKIGLQDIRDAKADKITSQKGPVGGGFGHIAAGAGGWHLIHSAMMGNPEGMVTGGALAATPYVLAKVLKNPSVVRLLSEPTPADIAAIPPELRGDLPALVKAAQAQGIKVHPAFVVMAGATNAPHQ